MCLLASSRVPAWPLRPPAFDVLLGQLGAYQVPRKVRNEGPLQLAFPGLRTPPPQALNADRGGSLGLSKAVDLGTPSFLGLVCHFRVSLVKWKLWGKGGWRLERFSPAVCFGVHWGVTCEMRVKWVK